MHRDRFEKQFGDDALAALEALPLPGNVRELKHIVTRAAVFSVGTLIDRSAIETAAPATALPQVKTCSEYESLDYRTARDRFENDYFSAVIKKAGGNITAAAATIGMAQSNLSRKLKELGLR
jgi:DNA-binding NtrC family response regulator